MLTHRDMKKSIIMYIVSVIIIYIASGKKNPLTVLRQLRDFFIYKLMEVLQLANITVMDIFRSERK